MLQLTLIAPAPSRCWDRHAGAELDLLVTEGERRPGVRVRANVRAVTHPVDAPRGVGSGTPRARRPKSSGLALAVYQLSSVLRHWGALEPLGFTMLEGSTRRRGSPACWGKPEERP
jgi:hypothetical protein